MPNPFRCTEAEVLAIIDTKLDSEKITEFLRAANILTTARCAGHYSAEILKLIELNLTAHFVSVREFRVRSKSMGDENITYFATSTIGEGLAATPHGQTVQLIDNLGLLSRGTSAGGGSTPGTTFIEAF